jgi:tRNA (cytidine/uridine-2'-O-)-methyltransferase
MHVVLVHPDIPWNTGNIGRTCVATKTSLHLVKPLGFSLDDSFLKRAGLDYWKKLDLCIHESFGRFRHSELTQKPMFLFSRFAKKSFWEAPFTSEAVLIFGSETKGLPKSFLKKYQNISYRIPTPGPVRSLNLSTAVGVVLFEAIRISQRLHEI